MNVAGEIDTRPFKTTLEKRIDAIQDEYNERRKALEIELAEAQRTIAVLRGERIEARRAALPEETVRRFETALDVQNRLRDLPESDRTILTVSGRASMSLSTFEWLVSGCAIEEGKP